MLAEIDVYSHKRLYRFVVIAGKAEIGEIVWKKERERKT